MNTRREFIWGTFSLAVVGQVFGEEVKNRVEAAAYYSAYLDDVASRVKENARTCDTGFWFITDQHVKSNHRQSGTVCADLIGRTGLARVLCGGDLPEAFGKGYASDKAAVDYAIDTFSACWVKPIRSVGGKIYCTKGNHDFTVRHSYDKADPVVGFTYPGKVAKQHIVDTWTEPGVVTNAADPSACYYYFDDAAAKIRFVVADTSDAERSGPTTAWGVSYSVHDTQLAWLAGQAFGTLPAGFNLVVMHHIPVAGVVTDERTCKTFANLRNLLEAFQGRGRLTVGAQAFDFSQATGRILMDLTGHQHAERQTFLNGILHVTEPCDAAYGDYIIGSKPWCDNLPRKQKGTIYEQTFEAIQFARDRSYVRLTRVGGGHDRAIHLVPQTVRVGETVKIEPKLLAGPFTFACYDGDRVMFRPNPKSRWCPLIAYGNDFAEISPAGVLSARKAGPVVVMAYDARQNREIFPVTVVG